MVKCPVETGVLTSGKPSFTGDVGGLCTFWMSGWGQHDVSSSEISYYSGKVCGGMRSPGWVLCSPVIKCQVQSKMPLYPLSLFLPEEHRSFGPWPLSKVLELGSAFWGRSVPSSVNMGSVSSDKNRVGEEGCAPPLGTFRDYWGGVLIKSALPGTVHTLDCAFCKGEVSYEIGSKIGSSSYELGEGHQRLTLGAIAVLSSDEFSEVTYRFSTWRACPLPLIQAEYPEWGVMWPVSRALSICLC